MLGRLDVPLPDELGHRTAEVAVGKAVSQTDDIAFRVRPVLLRVVEPADGRLIELAIEQHLHRADTQQLEVFERAIPVEADIPFIPDRESVQIALQRRVGDGVLGVEVLGADAPPLWDVVGDTPPESLRPIPTRVMQAVDAPRMEVVGIEARVLAIHLLGDDHATTREVTHILELPVVGVQPLGPGQVMCPWVLHLPGEAVEHAAGGQDFLDALILKQLTAQTPAVGQDLIAPLVVALILVEVVWDKRALNATRLANRLQ